MITIRSFYKPRRLQISVRNNIIWSLSLGFLQIGLATIIAFILARRPRFWKTLRTVYFVPKVISGVAIAMLWKAVYNAEYGALNAVLSLITGQEWSHNWLGAFNTALPAIIAQEVMYIGYFMIIYSQPGLCRFLPPIMRRQRSMAPLYGSRRP
ncbi:MAG: hypothetical protein U5P10_12195 [Spirochaetia bacterium]|nr:hypothetical protein [Spirochaetia bacterium]